MNLDNRQNLNVPLILFNRNKEGITESEGGHEKITYDYKKQMPVLMGGGGQPQKKKGTKCYKNKQTRKKLGAGTQLTMDKKHEIDDSK